MDITTYQTQLAKTGTQGQATGQTAVAGGGTGLFATLPGGATFMDLIFARLGAQAQNGAEVSLKNTKADGKKGADALASLGMPVAGLQTEALLEVQPEGAAPILPATLINLDGEALPTEEKKIDIDEALAFFASFGDIRQQTAVSATGEKTVGDLTQKQGEKLVDMLAHLMRGLPEESRPQLLSATPGQFRAAVNEQLQKLLADPSATQASPALITANLTPSKLNDLIQTIASGEAATDAAEDNSILANLVKLMAPTKKGEAVFVPRASLNVQNKIQSQAQEHASAQAQAKANVNSAVKANDTAIADASATASAEAHAEDIDAFAATLNALEVGGESKPEGGLERVLKILEQAQQPQNGAAVKPQNNDNAKQTSPGLSTINGAPGAIPGDLSAATQWDSLFPDGFNFSLTADGRPQGLTVTGTGTMTSLISHAPHAAQPHPATQVVAVAMSKMTATGESKNFTVRLDPPDLGKVEIKMEFNSEKHSTKTHLVVEKPETFLMLQRDAHILERLIQDSGMSAGGGSLSFELSQNGNFGQDNGQHGGSNDSGGGSGGSSDDGEEILETTMNWYIDPATGMTRYNILA